MSNDTQNATIKRLAESIHATAVEKGWWGEDGKGTRNIPEMLALIHSEVSEALEDYRDGKMATYLDVNRKPCGFASELADVVIRIADLCEALGIDLEAEMLTKMAFNRTRAYRHGGKAA